MINKYFVIYGERNSGTNYLETILTGKSYHLSYDISAFKTAVINTSIQEIYNDKYGYKHFFGFHDKIIKNASSNIVFIGIVRNPYDWIMALYRSKHHIPLENQDIKNFLNKEWYSIQHNKNDENYGQELIDDRDFTTGHLPRLSHLYEEPNLPKRYKNIFDMRSKKLRYLFHSMPILATNYEFIRYEDFCSNPTSVLIEWSKKYDLELNPLFLQPIEKKPYSISTEIKEIIDNGIDWEIENQINYFKQ
jgi:hypothetical protein